MNLKSAQDRYLNDPVFYQLVKTIESAIENLELTPSEVRAAYMLAAILVEQRSPFARSLLRDLDEKISQDVKLANYLRNQP